MPERMQTRGLQGEFPQLAIKQHCFRGDPCFAAFWYAAGLINRTDLHSSSEYRASG
jgi:hypothetical protein